MLNNTGKLVRVRVRAGARKESFVEKTGYFEIATKEPAAMNRANARVITLFARHFSVSAKRVQIVAGHHSARKTIQIV